jgi:hypothetical protein
VFGWREGTKIVDVLDDADNLCNEDQDLTRIERIMKTARLNLPPAMMTCLLLPQEWMILNS